LLMREHNFSTNIAFIPWNHRRTSASIIRLFRDNPSNYSISVHGCDHTRAEFGGSDLGRLYAKAQLALKRMDNHQAETGLNHERVMVFPQGIFSEEAMTALKHTTFFGAVNNDVVSAEPLDRAITIRDVWDVAVMRYKSFPIFTRRYPWEGLENFAFDIVLGKPVIIVIHHDYCADHCVRLVNFVDRLNALKGSVIWRSLGEVVRRSCRQRNLSEDVVNVEMYGKELRLENNSNEPKRYIVTRQESDPAAIEDVQADLGMINYKFARSYINFELDLKAGQSTVIRIKFRELPENEHNEDTLPYKVKAMARRYLCEIRDNYVTTTKLRLAEFPKILDKHKALKS
jgi:hypothetical protein